MTSPFDDAPAVVRALVPEASDAGAGEARADCARCPMVASGAPHPWGFAAETRCCTVHPPVPNFLVGRALARDGETRARIVARLADPDGVTAWGIDPPPAVDRRYQRGGADTFGRDLGLRCPFWVGGEHSCGLWRDRPAVCRAWFCKHDDGLGAAVAWSQLGVLVAEAESRVAIQLRERGTPPPEGATIDAWLAWFAWCAQEVLALDGDHLVAMTTPGLVEQRAELVTLRRRPARRIGDVLVASVSEWVRDGDRVWLTGYSTYDAVAAPLAVFGFLAQLDGVTEWRAALAALGAERAVGLDEALITELYRVGAVRNADGSDGLPFTVEPVRGAAWSHEARRPR